VEENERRVVRPSGTTTGPPLEGLSGVEWPKAKPAPRRCGTQGTETAAHVAPGVRQKLGSAARRPCPSICISWSENRFALFGLMQVLFEMARASRTKDDARPASAAAHGQNAGNRGGRVRASSATRANMVNQFFSVCFEQVQKASPATSSGRDSNGLSTV
jgi:hypothetical protein